MQTIKKGTKERDAVKVLQHLLHLQVDGIFGPLTEEAVKQFQKEHNLTQDGIVGPKTWEALGIKEPVLKELSIRLQYIVLLQKKV